MSKRPTRWIHLAQNFLPNRVNQIQLDDFAGVGLVLTPCAGSVATTRDAHWPAASISLAGGPADK